MARACRTLTDAETTVWVTLGQASRSLTSGEVVAATELQPYVALRALSRLRAHGVRWASTGSSTLWWLQ